MDFLGPAFRALGFVFYVLHNSNPLLYKFEQHISPVSSLPRAWELTSFVIKSLIFIESGAALQRALGPPFDVCRVHW